MPSGHPTTSIIWTAANFSRVLRAVSPGATAVATHGRGIEQILTAPTSHYKLMAVIGELASRWAPAIWLGFNSLRFDDEFVRHGLYAALRQPYATQYSGNTRSDVLRASQLASVLEPGSIIVPQIGAKVSFMLELLSAANGYTGHAAHDALEDVRATAHVLRTIAANAPSTWALLSRLANKNAVVELLREGEFVVLVEHFGVAVTRPVVPICANPDYPTEWLAIDESIRICGALRTGGKCGSNLSG